MPKILYLKRLPKHQDGEWAIACKNAGKDVNSIFMVGETYDQAYKIPELGPCSGSNGHLKS